MILSLNTVKLAANFSSEKLQTLSANYVLLWVITRGNINFSHVKCLGLTEHTKHSSAHCKSTAAWFTRLTQQFLIGVGTSLLLANCQKALAKVLIILQPAALSFFFPPI